jgi:hypothetical protein
VPSLAFIAIRAQPARRLRAVGWASQTECIVKRIGLLLIPLFFVSCSGPDKLGFISPALQKTEYIFTLPGKWTRTITPISHSNGSSKTNTNTIAPTRSHPATITTARSLFAGRFTLKADRTNEGLPESFFDLDTGEVIDSEEADIKLYSGCEPICMERLIPINGSVYYFNGQEEPSLDTCMASKGRYTTSDTRDLNYNGHYCVLTNWNNYSIITILSYDVYYNVVEVGFSYKTWK